MLPSWVPVGSAWPSITTWTSALWLSQRAVLSRVPFLLAILALLRLKYTSRNPVSARGAAGVGCLTVGGCRAGGSRAGGSRAGGGASTGGGTVVATRGGVGAGSLTGAGSLAGGGASPGSLTAIGRGCVGPAAIGWRAPAAATIGRDSPARTGLRVTWLSTVLMSAVTSPDRTITTAAGNFARASSACLASTTTTAYEL